MRLNLGCGSDIWIGYINVDIIPQEGVDIVCDIFDLPDDLKEVEEIRAHHVLEHIPFGRSLEFVRLVHSRLRRGGKFVLEVPDLEWVLANWLAQPDPEHWTETLESDRSKWGYYLMSIYGNQSKHSEQHRTGFTMTRLSVLLKTAGFARIQIQKVWNYEQLCLYGTAVRP